VCVCEKHDNIKFSANLKQLKSKIRHFIQLSFLQVCFKDINLINSFNNCLSFVLCNGHVS